MIPVRVESTPGSPRMRATLEGDDVPDIVEDFDAGALLVCCHHLLNDLGVIGSAARTLVERKDQLPPHIWEALAQTIADAVDRGAERLRIMVVAPLMAQSRESHTFR
jgi:hypothetical protein